MQACAALIWRTQAVRDIILAQDRRCKRRQRPMSGEEEMNEEEMNVDNLK